MSIFFLRKLLILTIIFWCGISFAQNFRLYKYTTEDGLPTNLVKSIVADSKGFIWLGSDAGLSRFDGKNFLNFKQEFPNPYTKGLYLSDSGRLFVVNDMALFDVNYHSYQPKLNLLLEGSNSPEPNKLNYPKTIFQSANGAYWLSEPQSIVKYDSKGFKRYHFAEPYRTQSFNRSFSIFAFDNQIYTVSFSGHVFRYDSAKDEFILLNGRHLQTPTHAVLQMGDQFLFGTSDGLYKVSLKGDFLDAKRILSDFDISCLEPSEEFLFIGTWSRGIYFVEKDLLLPLQPVAVMDFPFKHVNDIFCDRENGIWTACDEGVVLVKPTYFTKFNIPMADAYIQNIYPVDSEHIWITEGSRVWEIEKKSKKVKNIFNSPDNSNLLASGKVGDKIVAGSLSDNLFYLQNGKISIFEEHNKGVVFYTHSDKDGNLWACRYGDKNLVYKISKSGELKEYNADNGIIGRILVVNSIGDDVFLGGEGSSWLYRYDKTKDLIENITPKNNFDKEFVVNDIFPESKNKIYIAANKGLFVLENQVLKRIDLGETFADEPIKAVSPAKGGGLWLGSNLGLVRYLDGSVLVFDETAGLPTRTIALRGIYQSPEGTVWVATANGLVFAEPKQSGVPYTITPEILSLKADGKQVLPDELSELPFDTELEITFATLSYPNDKTRYQYRLDSQWVDLEDNRLFLTKLDYKKHKLEIRAKQPGNHLWSKSKIIEFVILRPWYLSIGFILLSIVGLSGIVYLIVLAYTYRLRLQKAALERLVKERTQEISEQKNQILAQKQEIERQNESIRSSINTASRIQKAILPSAKRLEAFAADYFLLYEPKEIVSGDFVWIGEEAGYKVVAVGDCTGHGVPGALMSMIGISLIGECVKIQKILSPEKILEYVSERLVAALRQEGSQSVESIDLAVCTINNHTLEFAGARRPGYVQKADGTIHKFLGISRTVGGFSSEKTKPFVKEAIAIAPGDCLYLFSDGLTDQFGGENHTKFTTKRFEDVLMQTIGQTMSQRLEVLKQRMSEWRGQNRLLDDVVVLGIKL